MAQKGLLLRAKDGKFPSIHGRQAVFGTKGSLIRRFSGIGVRGSAESLVADLLAHGHLKPGELKELESRFEKRRSQRAFGGVSGVDGCGKGS